VVEAELNDGSRFGEREATAGKAGGDETFGFRERCCAVGTLGGLCGGVRRLPTFLACSRGVLRKEGTLLDALDSGRRWERGVGTCCWRCARGSRSGS